VLQDAGKPANAYAVPFGALDCIRDAGKHTQPTPTSSASPPTPDLSSSSADVPANAAIVMDLPPPPTLCERMRVFALLEKLGAIAEEYALPAVERNDRLLFTVEEMLRIVKALLSASPLEALARLVSPQVEEGTKDAKDAK
jgi:hypothetical protein